MNKSPLRTLIVGFGRIAQGHAFDAVMAKTMKYATHAQVLKDHPGYSLEAVIDPNEEALSLAKQYWRIPKAFKRLEDLPEPNNIDVAVLATHPQDRLNYLEYLPNLKAVLVEKPLGIDFSDAAKFVSYCQQRKLPTQVNLTRRADSCTLHLAKGKLRELIGLTQIVHGVYGNGVKNNGTHMIDLIRMLFGEIERVQALPLSTSFIEGPLQHDLNFPFILQLLHGLTIVMQPLHFSNYRENGLDIWGEKGRFEYMHGGLTLTHYPSGPNRALDKTNEVAIDKPMTIASTLSTALWEMYDNLYKVVCGHENRLLSPVESAFETLKVIESAIKSHESGGIPVEVKEHTASTS